MLVPDYLVCHMRDAAEALEAAPIEPDLKIVQADAPAYAGMGLVSQDLLHPLVEGRGRNIGLPFTFHRFGLAVTAAEGDRLVLRLLPPEGAEISTPIVRPQQPDFYKHLPRIGFSGLRAVVEPRGSNANPFSLFGEDTMGQPGQELTMPSQEAAISLIKVVSGQVIVKSFEALSS